MDHDQQKKSSDGEKLDEVVLPGFRFHPTDEELVGFYLKRKTQQRPLSIELIKQLDIYKHDPWDLPKMAATGEKEWYFYCPRDRKYRNSTRPNRVTKAGFWKATGTDRPVYSSQGSNCIGLKKSLVFYKGRAAKGIKTDWMMHEFRLPSSSSSDTSCPPKRCLDKTLPQTESWAICRIFRKTSSVSHRTTSRSWISPSLPQPNLVLSSNLTSSTTNSTISPHQDQLTSSESNNMFSSMKPERPLPIILQISSNADQFYTGNEVVDNSSTAAADDSPLFNFPSYYEPNKDHQHGMMLPPLTDVSLPLVKNHPDINSGDISCVLGDYLGNKNVNDNYYNDNESCMSLEGLHDHLIIGNAGSFFSSGSLHLQEELQGGMLSDFDRRDDLWDVVKSFRFPLSAASDVGLL